MRVSNFHSNFGALYRAKDEVMMKDVVLSELADLMVNERTRVIDILNESGIYTDTASSRKELSEKITKNLANKRMLNRFAHLIAIENKNDFRNFSGSNKGKKVTGNDFVNQIMFALSGSASENDTEALAEKAEEMGGAEGAVTVLRTNRIKVAGVAVVCLGLVSVIMFKPQWVGLN